MSLVLYIDKKHPVRPRERYRFESAGLRLIKLGRLRSAHIPLDEASASRVQASIQMLNGHAVVENLGKKGSLHVNNMPLDSHEKSEIYTDDQLRVGTTLLNIKLRPMNIDPTYTGVREDLMKAVQGAGNTTCVRMMKALHLGRGSHNVGADSTSPQKVRARHETGGRVEKYNTAFLVAQFRRQERHHRRAYLLLVGVLLAGLALALSDPSIIPLWFFSQ